MSWGETILNIIIDEIGLGYAVLGVVIGLIIIGLFSTFAVGVGIVIGLVACVTTLVIGYRKHKY